MSDTQTTTAPAAVAPDAAMLDARLIPVGLIDRDPAQPRRHFHVDTLEATAEAWATYEAVWAEAKASRE